MKNFDVTQYFWVFRIFAFLGLVWSTQILQRGYRFVTDDSGTIPWEIARMGQDSMETFWSNRIDQISQPNYLAGDYTPAMYFADYRAAREIWIRVTGDTLTPIGLSQGQNRAMMIMQRAHPSRIAIDAAYTQFIEPIRPLDKPVNWGVVWSSILAWLLRLYWFGLPFAGVLFLVWFYENPYFKRFAGGIGKFIVVTALWPLFLWLVLKRKFEDHYYSLMAEVVVRRTKQFVGGALTRTEKLLVRDLETNRVGIRQGARVLLQNGFTVRHGLLVRVFVVCALRVSAQLISIASPLSSCLSSSGVQNNEYAVRNMFCRTGEPGFSTLTTHTSILTNLGALHGDCVADASRGTSRIASENHSRIIMLLDFRVREDGIIGSVRKIKEYFHYGGELFSGFVRIQEPVPWVE